MSPKKLSNISNSTPNAATKKTASARKALVAAFIGVGLVLIVAAAASLLWPKAPAAPAVQTVAVALGTATIQAKVADTPQTRGQGLSDTASLAENAGMLFVFARDDTWQFWMKDMQYPLDILWLGANKQVVDIKPGVPPGSFPETFAPAAKARYVLEVAAGTATKAGVKTGDFVVFSVPPATK